MEIIKTYNHIIYNDCNMLLGSKYSTRIKALDNESLKEKIDLVHKNGYKAFINLNQIFHNKDILDLENYLKLLKEYKADYIVFSDLGVLNVSKRLNMENMLIYNPDTLLTNYLDINLFKSFNIYGCFISPFLNIEEIKEIISKKEIKLFYIGVGKINLMYSKRRLVDTYFDYVKKDYSDGFYELKEETRDQIYPFVQDDKGSHLFTPYVVSYKKYEKDLKEIDYIIYDDYLVEDLNSAYLNGETGFLEKNIIYRKENF